MYCVRFAKLPIDVPKFGTEPGRSLVHGLGDHINREQPVQSNCMSSVSVGVTSDSQEIAPTAQQWSICVLVVQVRRVPETRIAREMDTDRKLRINWIFTSTGLSGGVKSNRLIAEAMARRGHDVCLYYSHAIRMPPPFWRVHRFSRWLRKNFNRHIIRERHHLSLSKVPVVPVRRWPILHQDVRDADISIATWWESAEWIADWPACKGEKFYFIRHYEVHGKSAERANATYSLPLRKLVIANWLKRLMAESFGDDNAVLVPNGVDRQQFYAVVRDRGQPATVGMLYGQQKWKGAHTAFAAIRLLQRTDPTIRVVAFGSSRPPNDQNLPANLEFYLAPPQEEIRQIYSQADCWIVPSTTEGFGMPGIEAAACRCPLVVTRCGGPEDYLCEGSNGFLVPVEDPAAMAQRIGQVLALSNDQWRSMSRASFEMSLRFDWDRSAATLEQALLQT